MKLLDLCAGIGGFRAAAESFLPTVETRSVEYDRWATRTYGAIFGEATQPVDITSVTRPSSEVPPIERVPAALKRRIRAAFGETNIVTAGLPCQPHSLMGNRQGGLDVRGELFWDIAAIIESLEPEHFVLENVR